MHPVEPALSRHGPELQPFHGRFAHHVPKNLVFEIEAHPRALIEPLFRENPSAAYGFARSRWTYDDGSIFRAREAKTGHAISPRNLPESLALHKAYEPRQLVRENSRLPPVPGVRPLPVAAAPNKRQRGSRKLALKRRIASQCRWFFASSQPSNASGRSEPSEGNILLRPRLVQTREPALASRTWS